MKKFILVIFNIFLLIILYFLCEYLCFANDIYQSWEINRPDKTTYMTYLLNNSEKFFMRSTKKYSYTDNNFRPVAGKKYKEKPPLVLFGCSYVYGSWLKDNQIFSYKLSDYTKRTVYNRAQIAWGVQNMLYQVRQDDFYDIFDKNPEYVIYVYIEDHINRLYRECPGIDSQIYYRNSKDGLKAREYKGIFNGYTAKKIRNIIAEKNIHTNKTKELLIKHFVEAKKEMQKHWKDTQYYILVYNSSSFSENCFKELEIYGYKIIFARELTSEDIYSTKYCISESDVHPNEKAWNLLVPLLAEKIGID